MTPLFPSWFDSVFRFAVAIALVSILAIPVALMAWVRSPLHTDEGLTVSQPVQFDHRHHVRDDGIDCLYCHYDAERSPSAGVPDTATCMGCHAQVWKDSPELEPVRQSYYRKRPIAWKRVHDLPDFVYFSHEIHVHRGVGCESCHGRVDQMAEVSKSFSLSMGFCLDCHRHPERHLRPQSAITEMGYSPRKPQLEVGRRLARELDVHPPTYCSGCHR